MAAGMRKIAHYGEKKQAAPHITHKCKDLRPHSTNANGNKSQSERSDAEGRKRGPSQSKTLPLTAQMKIGRTVLR